MSAFALPKGGTLLDALGGNWLPWMKVTVCPAPREVHHFESFCSDVLIPREIIATPKPQKRSFTTTFRRPINRIGLHN